MHSYWQRFTSKRVSRRRAITATGSAAAAAAFLAACGGDDTPTTPAPAATTPPGQTPAAPGPTPTQAPSGLMGTPTQSTPQAGRTLRHYHGSDIDTFDATVSATSQTVALSSEPFYPRMLALNTATYPNEADGSSRGEAAESWELSDGGMQITFKLRPNMLWDHRPPTNNRAIDAQDVLFSYNKFIELNGAALSLAANIDTVTAPDDQTIVVRMKEPDASIIPLFSGRDLLYLQPREADGAFDPRQEVRGHGPWLLDEYVPSGHFTYVRNPDYYDNGRPYPDRVDVPIITELATRLAQFRAGNIFTDVLAASQEDIVPTRKDLPNTLLLQSGAYSPSSTNLLTFGWDQGAPWHDKRNRQALSLMIDREAYVDVIFNRDRFAADGLDVPIRYNSIVPGGWGEEFWLDPTNESQFGPEARLLQYDPAEAKKLLAAAGNPNGFPFNLYYNGGPQFGPAYAKQADLYAGWFADGGLQVTQQPITPFDTWLSHYSRRYTVAFGIYSDNPHHSGVSVIAERVYSTLAVQIRNQFHPAGQGYRGMVPPGGTLEEGDPKSNDLAIRISREFDRNRHISLVHEMIRYQTDEMYYVPRVAAEKSFSLWWPAVGNVGVDVGYPNSAFWADQRRNWWVDNSKAPLA